MPEKKQIILSLMAAIVFTDIRKTRTTEHEAIESSAKIANLLYKEVDMVLHPYLREEPKSPKVEKISTTSD